MDGCTWVHTQTISLPVRPLNMWFGLSARKSTRRYAGPRWFLLDADLALQIPELIEFEDRLENSLQRDLAKMEHVRMRVFHEPMSTDLTDMELIELKFIFARRESIFLTPKTMSVEPFSSAP